MNKKKFFFVICISFVFCLCLYPQDVDYICHVSCDGIPGGVKIRYCGDYEGTALTPFDIGPYPEPFRVILEPVALDIQTTDYDGFYTMGWQWATNENPYPFGKIHMTVETRPSSPEISAEIRYVSYSSPTIAPSPAPTYNPSYPDTTKAPPPFWDTITIAGVSFYFTGYNPDTIMLRIQPESTIVRALEWGIPEISGHVITIDTQLIEWKGPCPQEETWLSHDYQLEDLTMGEVYTLIIKGWGVELASFVFTHDEPVPTPFAIPDPPWEIYKDPAIIVDYQTTGGITTAEVSMLLIENEMTDYTFYRWSTLQREATTFTAAQQVYRNPGADGSVMVEYYSRTYNLGALSSGTYTFMVESWDGIPAYVEDFVVDAEQTPAPQTPSPTPWTEPFVEVRVSMEEVLYPVEDSFTVTLENFGGECDFRLHSLTASTWVNYDRTSGHLSPGESVIITGRVDWSQFSTDAGYGYYTTVEVSAPGYVEDIRYYLVLNYNGPTVTPSVPSTPSPTPTADPGITPTPTPTMTPGAYNYAGAVWFDPEEMDVPRQTDFFVEVHANSGSALIGVYELDITYDPAIITVDTSRGTNGVEAGAHAPVSAANAGEPGLLSITGFDATGMGPGLDLHIATIFWISGTEAGTTDLDLEVDSFITLDLMLIGSPDGYPGRVTVTDEGPIAGDVNGSGIVDIVDALLTAQHYVGLNPPGFNSQTADVNCDNAVDIVDALLIAQYYVGLITGFC